MTATKCTRKANARAELLFWLLSELFFDVLVAVAVVVAKAPYSVLEKTSVARENCFETTGYGGNPNFTKTCAVFCPAKLNADIRVVRSFTILLKCCY